MKERICIQIRIRGMKYVSVNEIALLLSQDEIRRKKKICMTTAKRKKAIKIDDERHQKLSCFVLRF